MSRLTTLSAEALRTIFSPEADADLMFLLTIYSPEDDTTPVLRLADGFTQRLSETADEIVYGVRSRSEDFIFLPMEISLPSEEENQAPRSSLVMHDVTQYVVPLIRTIKGPPRIKMELVLTKTPDIVEASFSDFYINGFTYNSGQVSAELAMVDYDREPFPVHSFTPRHFPGLF